MNLTRAISFLRRRGLLGLASRRRQLLARRSLSATAVRLVAGRSGLEVGGPSPIFRSTGALPLYGIVSSLDCCNFASVTVWEGRLSDGQPFKPEGHVLGRQHVAEMLDLSFAAPGHYDFVLSSHALEHTANPIRALREMARVLKPDGALILIVPPRDSAFDHRRPLTILEHLIDDERANVDESDLTHLPEILALHDLSRDPGIDNKVAFESRSRANAQNRCLHHHVFDLKLLSAVAKHVGFAEVALGQPSGGDLVYIGLSPSPASGH